MGFGQAVKTCLFRKYFTFSGRASRSEFWWFSLFYWLTLIFGLTIGFFMVDIIYEHLGMRASDGPEKMDWFILLLYMVTCVAGVHTLLLIIPTIAVTVRRLHDRNLSGWWYLFYCVTFFFPGVALVVIIVMIMVLARIGDPGYNRFGGNPLGGDASSKVFA